MKNNKNLFLKAIIILFFLINIGNTFSSEKLNFNKDWKFLKLDKSVTADQKFSNIKFDDASWENVSLPHTANIEPLVVNDQWQGICWYRKEFEAPKGAANKKIYIEFEAAMNIATIWVNGIKVKHTQGGYLPIVIDVTPFVKFDQKNSIAVRLDNTDNPVTGPKPLKILDFNMYGGLYRNAWMITKNKTHITIPQIANKIAGGGIFITFPKVSDKEAVVKFKTHVKNESAQNQSVEVQQSLYFAGKLVETNKSNSILLIKGTDQEIIQEIKVKTPALWSPVAPNLYDVRTSLLVNGKAVETEKNKMGIREFEIKGNDLYINGKKEFLRGVNRHQEYPFIGYALSDNAQYRDAKKIKDAGFDYVRLSHYPHSTAFMKACDELGLVVVDAILGWQYYAETDDFRNFCYTSSRDLIRRDRNHACVLAWEVSLNETKMPIPFMTELDRIVHEEFPGKNVYSCGWMDDVYDIYLQARQHRIMHASDPKKAKEKPYIVSEYGDWEYYSSNAGLNQHQFSKSERLEKSSRQTRENGEKGLLQQAYNLQESHNDNFKTKAFADGYWVMYDYNRGYHNDIEKSGVMDIFRIPKFGYYFYQSQREAEKGAMVYIASYWTPESALDLTVFSNCEKVKLYLNDKLVAEQSHDVNKNSDEIANPPFTFKMKAFEAGTLKAVGIINDKEVTEHIVKTPQKATALKVWVDESGKKPQVGCNDVVFVYVAAIDDNGTIVPDFNADFNVNINGDAKIMNPDKLTISYGIGTVVMQIANKKKTIKVEATANGLKNCSYKIPLVK